MKKKLLTCIICVIAITCNGQIISDCSICDRQLLTEDHLDGKSLEELSMLRNEIYARKGYIFNNGSYRSYFRQQDWYKPVKSNEEINLSDIELKNISLLKSLEERASHKRRAAIRDLNKIKNALNNNEKDIIEEFLNKMKEEPAYKELLKSLKETLNHIDLDNIHWNREKGLYKVTIDNGYLIFGYQILFEGNDIRIETGEYSHSEIFGDFGDGYSDYESINEYSYWWVFEMKESGIVYRYFGAAG